MTELDELKHERAKAWDDHIKHEYSKGVEPTRYLPKYKKLDKQMKEMERNADHSH